MYISIQALVRHISRRQSELWVNSLYFWASFCIEVKIQAVFGGYMLSCSQRRALAQASYTFMTGVSCSSELCGRMVLLFECSFSRFCKKPLLLRPSRMTVLLELRLTWVLGGGRERKGAQGWYASINMQFEQSDELTHTVCPPTYQGAQQVQCQKRSLFFPFD